MTSGQYEFLQEFMGMTLGMTLDIGMASRMTLDLGMMSGMTLDLEDNIRDDIRSWG